MPGGAGQMAPRQPRSFGVNADAVHAMASAFRPLPQTVVAARSPGSFAQILETSVYPGEESNTKIIDRFNRGQVKADDVLRVTSFCVNRHGSDWNAAVACLHALGRCGRQNQQTSQWERVVPNTIIYNTAISACEKAGRADKALALVNHLLEHGPKFPVPAFPDTITYSAAISACAKAGEADKALELFDQLLEQGPKCPVPIFPNAITYSAVISACDKAGRVDRYPGLLRHGIDGCPGKPETKVFQPTLGFDPGSNTLDLHEAAVLTRPTDPGARNPAVHSAVARAIFHCLLDNPRQLLGEGAAGINDKTVFVVGYHGADTVKQAVAQCMLEQGWIAGHSPGANGLPNPGRLVVVRTRLALPSAPQEKSALR